LIEYLTSVTKLEMNNKDIRSVLSIAKLVHNVEDVSWLVETFKRYGRIPGGTDNSYGDMG
jgi:hypothetical protein